VPGTLVPCPEKDLTEPPVLAVRWKAQATYTVEALEDVSETQLGFPAQSWNIDTSGADGMGYPYRAVGIVHFKTSQDGKEIKTELKAMSAPGNRWKNADTAYVWKSSFKKGKRYSLVSQYLFAESGTNDFYENTNHPKGLLPWFYKYGEPFRTAKQYNKLPWSADLYYYLTPLKEWAAPPPEHIFISLQTRQDVPVEFFVPVRPLPSCVESHGLHYHYKNQFPEEDFAASYAVKREHIPRKFKTAADAKDWALSVGLVKTENSHGKELVLPGQAQISCELKKRMKLLPDSIPCVERCE
jgi:hypothetical protein